MKRVLVLVGWLASVTFLGCNSGSTASTDGASQPQQAAASDGKTVEFNTDDPKQVVMALIEAMKSGDKEAKEALLTTKAREETAKHEMPVAADAMPNTEYQIADPTYLEKNPNGAHVQCLLTETLQDGSKADYEIIWVLRREQEIGWRIAGMAVELAPGTPKQFLNFEDPLDMQEKMNEAAKAMEAQSVQSADASTPAEEGVNQAQATEPVGQGTKLR